MRTTLLITSLMVGCSGSGAPGGSSPITPGTASALEGLYQLEGRTENDSGCDEGPSVLDTTREHMFFLVREDVFGAVTVMWVSCADEANCRAKLQSLRDHTSFSAEQTVTFGEEPSSGTLAGFRTSTGFEQDGVCTERGWIDHLLSRAGDAVRLESRSKDLPDKPPDAEGFCLASPSEDEVEASGLPCTGLEVFAGQRVGDL